MRYPKLKGMMPNLPANAIPAAPRLPMPGAAMPKTPTMAPTAGARPFASPTMPTARLTVPSITASTNQATPIELGDPQRLARIATILRMGRK